ncbi:MAG: hypothetical protein JAY85_10880 [Candidatus Thiodiazotropha weberae]|nr:hypothetical protein [Candidatus Thiodiazotropha endoloripes]MCG7898949.1 hypothetical protein [Candidatus Thiodiazotropha weberae]
MQNPQNQLIDSNDGLDRVDTAEMLRLSAEYTATLLALAMNDEVDAKPTPQLIEEVNYLVSEQLGIAKQLSRRDTHRCGSPINDVSCQGSALNEISDWRMPSPKWG